WGCGGHRKGEGSDSDGGWTAARRCGWGRRRRKMVAMVVIDASSEEEVVVVRLGAMSLRLPMASDLLAGKQQQRQGRKGNGWSWRQ
ncbi:hypothetical protein BHE74_00030323, partial [Ensete ventricosum]